MPFPAKATPRLSEQDKNRFCASLSIGEIDQCWNCQPDPATGGYGHAQFQGGKHYLHRIAWATFLGPVPKGVNVLHKCDNPPCCNPTHLFLGTHGDNMRDKASKGRGKYHTGESHHAVKNPEEMAHGEDNGSAKLSESDVLKIRRLYCDDGISQRNLAKRFEVSRGCIGFIVRGETWRHI